MQREWSQAFSSGAQCQDERQWSQTETQEVSSEHQETLFYCEGNWALERVVQRACGIFYLADIQKLSLQGPGQPSLGDPEVPFKLTILWFCHSVIVYLEVAHD